jgi:antitoxin (DNA-binding transcriptional repressor) of toxin-antitoxin stability system
MKAVGVRELKNRLSEYLRAVRAGERVLVTDRGEIIAELAPPGANRPAEPLDAALGEAVRQGWLTPPLIGPGSVPPAGPPVAPLAELVDELRRDRDAR